MTSQIPFALLGATGRVGRMVSQALRKSDGPFAGVPFQTRRTKFPGGHRHIPWDILGGEEGLTSWIASYGCPNALVVMSGVTPATGTQMDDNVNLGVRCLKAAHRHGIPRVLFASSSAVYGAGQGLPLNENNICIPLSAYGRSKLKMEEEVLGLATNMRVEVCCLRIGNVLGADALLSNARDGSKTTIDRFLDGHGPLRSYIAPGDLAHTLARLATTSAPLPNVMNIAAPQPVYMETLATAAELEWDFIPAPETALQEITLDCRRLFRHVSFPPTASNLADMIEDWKRNRCNDLDEAYL